jgi:hypothetical protein
VQEFEAAADALTSSARPADPGLYDGADLPQSGALQQMGVQ